MSYSHYSIEERFNIITECLQSGLSIKIWCKEHDIPSGTFYSWIDQVKKSGFQVELPSRSHKKSPVALKQDVVKVDIVPDVAQITACPPSSAHDRFINAQEKVMTLSADDFFLEIPNGTDASLLSHVIQALRCSV